jgi:hypothetical protein
VHGVTRGDAGIGRFVKGAISDLSTGGAAIALHDDLSVFYDEVKVVFPIGGCGSGHDDRSPRDGRYASPMRQASG